MQKEMVPRPWNAFCEAGAAEVCSWQQFKCLTLHCWGSLLLPQSISHLLDIQGLFVPWAHLREIWLMAIKLQAGMCYCQQTKQSYLSPTGLSHISDVCYEQLISLEEPKLFLCSWQMFCHTWKTHFGTNSGRNHVTVTGWWSEGTSGDLPCKPAAQSRVKQRGFLRTLSSLWQRPLALRFQLIALPLQTESLCRNLCGETASQFPIAAPPLGCAFAIQNKCEESPEYARRWKTWENIKALISWRPVLKICSRRCMPSGILLIIGELTRTPQNRLPFYRNYVLLSTHHWFYIPHSSWLHQFPLNKFLACHSLSLWPDT